MLGLFCCGFRVQVDGFRVVVRRIKIRSAANVDGASRVSSTLSCTGNVRKRYSRNVIPTEVEESFSLAVKCRMFNKEKWETPHRGERCFMQSGWRNKSGYPLQQRFLGCARNDETGKRLVPLVCFEKFVGRAVLS